MKNLLLFLSLFLYTLTQAQNKGRIYIGLYTAGLIETYEPIATAPYYTKLHYYTLSYLPKLGYQYKNITVGGIYSYTTHKNTFETLESTLGYGYFTKYNYLKKNRTSNKKMAIQFFGEWRHVVNDGYYVSILDGWHRAKIHSKTIQLTAQGGFDLIFPKSFSIGLGLGVGAFNTLKDPKNLKSEKQFKFRPYGTATLQYHLKL